MPDFLHGRILAFRQRNERRPGRRVRTARLGLAMLIARDGRLKRQATSTTRNCRDGPDKPGSQQQRQTQQTSAAMPPWVNDASQQNYALFAQQVPPPGPCSNIRGGNGAGCLGSAAQQSWNTAATARPMRKLASSTTPQTAGYFSGALGLRFRCRFPPADLQCSSQRSRQRRVKLLQGSCRIQILAPYMDPYTQSVINASLPDHAAAAGADAVQQRWQRAVNQGAFGGSRFGVAQQGTAQAQRRARRSADRPRS